MCPFVLVLIQQRVQSLLGTHPELGPRAASVQSTGGLLVRSGPTDRLFWVVWGQMLGTRSCREEGDGGGQLRSRRHGRCLAGAGPLPGLGDSSLLVLGALQVSTCVVAHSVAYLPVCLTDTDTLFYPAGKATRVGSEPGVTRAVMSRIQVGALGCRASTAPSLCSVRQALPQSSQQAWGRAQVSPRLTGEGSCPRAHRVRAEPVLLGGGQLLGSCSYSFSASRGSGILWGS